MSMRRYLLFGAALGALVPMCFWAAYYFSNHHYLFGIGTVILWPSSILLMATDGNEGTPGAFQIAALSVLLNVVLYCVGAAAVFGLRRLRRQF